LARAALPNHQRPTKWVVDLARQRLGRPANIVRTRLAAGDPSLSEALELMSFSPNLVGSQHVERFVPDRRAGARAPARQGKGAEVDGLDLVPATVLKPAPPPKPARAGSKPKAASKPAEADQRHDGDGRRQGCRPPPLLGGRDWHELPEAIARIAGRPSVAQVRQILRGAKDAIEQRVAQQDKH
jgi:hypothetical protein